MSKVVKWFRLNPLIKMPEWSEDKSYFSLYPTTAFRLNEGERAIVPLGISAELPEGYQLLIRPVPKLINYGINVCNTIIEQYDDLYYSCGKRHQIYIGMSIGAYNHYEFWPRDEIARAVIIKTPVFEFKDATEFNEVTDEKSKQLTDGVLNAISNPCGCDDSNEDESCGIETANIEGAG
jgi:dUTPase